MNPPANFILSEKVDKRKLRELFNDPVNNRTLRKQTTHEVEKVEKLAPPDAGQAPRTLSLLREWYGYDAKSEKTYFIGLFHYYKRPDGSIGASGKEDPIVLRIDGRLYIDP